MIVTICLSIALLSLAVLHIAIRSSKTARLIDRIPGPTPHPILGNLLMFNVSIDELWDLILKMMDDYYPIVRIWSLHLNAVVTCDVDDIKAILSCKKNIDKCKHLIYDGGKFLDNDGLLLSGGDKWRHRRKLISPAFGPNLMKVYTEIANEHSERLVNDIKNQNTEDVVIDTKPVFLKLALGIICEAAMGVDLRSFGVEEEEKFRNHFDEMSDFVFYRTLRPFTPDWILKLSSAGRKQVRVIESFRKFIDMVIQVRLEYYETIGYDKLHNVVDNIDDETSTSRGKKRLAFLDLLLAEKMNGLLDDKGMREEVETFMVAGYDTTGIVTAFALMLLAENKAVQDLAREEVTQLFEQTGGVLKMADFNNLDYLDRCIKETLRLYPGAPAIGRHVTENIKLKNYEIPQGTELFMHLFLLHRDPNCWPDPEKFDPDRFLPEIVKERHPFAYQPFSAGVRACIGSKFATLELKAIVARILYNFYIEPVDLLANMKLRMHVALRPKTTCRVRLVCINRKSTA